MENKDDKAILTERVSKIDKAVTLDREIKAKTAELNKIKADLQAEALQTMENRNCKYVEYFGTGSSVVVNYKEKFEIDNLPVLKEIFGSVLDDKITRVETVKLSIDSKFKKALTALYKEDYGKHDIKALLVEMGLDTKKATAAVKKLKGEYAKDLQVLRNFGLNVDDGAEEELDAIRESKNYDTVVKYIEMGQIDLEKLKRAVSVEETLAIGLVYDSEDI